MTRKFFVLDTNVLLHDPESLKKFPGNDIIIPLPVIEELDRIKRLPSELGRTARTVFFQLQLLDNKKTGDLHTGIKLENGATLKILPLSSSASHTDFRFTVSDNKILLSAFLLQEEGKKVIFVSKDLAARIKAEALGLTAQDYENLKYSYEGLHRGVFHYAISKHDLDVFTKDGLLLLEKKELYSNAYCSLTAEDGSVTFAIYDSKKKGVKPLLTRPNLWGIAPRNREQHFAMDALLRDEIRLVALVGPAGTGKTLLALACGMRKVFDEGTYNKILVSRPIMPLGKDIGYLPGTKEEKLSHWMQPIFDNLEMLCSGGRTEETNQTLQWVLGSKKIEMEAVTYIRGRTLPKMYMIIDEAQNLTPHEIKTIVSRAGENTKVILTGDPTQIDNPYLDKDSNALTYVIGRFKDQRIFSHIFLETTERSELAALAAEIL
jgi:PhoH-like ATPase